MNRLLLLSIIAWTHLFAVAQQPYFRHFGVEQGLSNTKVVCSLQDSLGFLWLGTRNGLNRFDGYQFNICIGTEDRVPGSGMGLALAKSLPVLQGGSLELMPNNEQNIFRLNLSVSTAKVVKTAAVATAAATNENKAAILLGKHYLTPP